jgi:putative Mg2+ transporter-C (MgtC) family protein
MDVRFHGHLPLRELVPYLLDVPGVKSVTVVGADPHDDDDDDSA